MIESVSDAREALERVRELWDASAGLARFRTPDGEVGRPGDNLYRLTFREARPNKLLLELDDQLLLIVTSPVVDAASPEEVRLSFAQLTFDWQEYGNLRPHASTWTSGQLILSAQ